MKHHFGLGTVGLIWKLPVPVKRGKHLKPSNPLPYSWNDHGDADGAMQILGSCFPMFFLPTTKTKRCVAKVVHVLLNLSRFLWLRSSHCNQLVANDSPIKPALKHKTRTKKHTNPHPLWIFFFETPQSHSLPAFAGSSTRQVRNLHRRIHAAVGSHIHCPESGRCDVWCAAGKLRDMCDVFKLSIKLGEDSS